MVAGEDDPHDGMDYRSDVGWIKRTNTKAPANDVSRHDQEAVSGYIFSI